MVPREKSSVWLLTVQVNWKEKLHMISQDRTSASTSSCCSWQSLFSIFFIKVMRSSSHASLLSIRRSYAHFNLLSVWSAAVISSAALIARSLPPSLSSSRPVRHSNNTWTHVLISLLVLLVFRSPLQALLQPLGSRLFWRSECLLQLSELRTRAESSSCGSEEARRLHKRWQEAASSDAVEDTWGLIWRRGIQHAESRWAQSPW